MSNARIYLVETKNGPHLVNAVSRAAAVAHVARSTMSARIPSQHEVFAMASSGVELECAKGAKLTDQSRADLAQSTLELEREKANAAEEALA